ncbi:MAG: hypothetical protein JSW27_15930 [Phycisphaerales bacterium]|nr:MAG: hypothetical protein JSW27_15930 [Phycisphaerales bacterium]
MAVDTKVILRKLVDVFGLGRADTEERLRLQKTIYLLQAHGVRLGYGFSWYKYGPYSQELVYDAYRALCAEEAEYKRKAGTITFNESTRQRFEKFRSALGDVLKDPKELELLASLSFVCKVWHPDAQRPDVARLFKTHKKCFYDRSPISDEAVRKAYDKLGELKKALAN